LTLLIAGVLLWSIAHLFPTMLPGVRAQLIEKLGAGPYRGLFSLDIVIAIVLMVVGWRSAEITQLYVPPMYGSPVISALMYLSFVLFAAANAPGNIKRLLRHPMLTGLAVWGAAHLLANGDNRSVVLFGGLGAWAIVMIVVLSVRDGAWQKPPAVALSRDLITLVSSAVVFAVIAFIHGRVFGVSPFPGM
jgi:uncharacterized membrane protein